MSSQNNYNIIRRNDMSGYLRQWLRHDICQFTAIAKKSEKLSPTLKNRKRLILRARIRSSYIIYSLEPLAGRGINRQMYVNLQIKYTLRDLKAKHIRASLEKKF